METFRKPVETTAYGTLQQRMDYIASSPRVLSGEVIAGELRLTLPSGAILSIAARELKTLRDYSDEELAGMLVRAGGRLLIWPKLGASIAVDGLLEYITGIRIAKFDPAITGAQGGSAKSEAKTTASRANGAKGGRPRKKVVSAG